MTPTRRIPFLAAALGAALLLSAACGLEGNPGVPVEFEPGPSGPPPPSRLYRDVVGKLHDRQLDNQSCDWMMPTIYCDRRCFPDPPMTEACGIDGKRYFSIAKGDTIPRKFGTKVIEKDSTCGGKTAHQIVELTSVGSDKLPPQLLDCKTAKDLSGQRVDRAWYLAAPSAIRPASVYELPVM